MAVLTYVQIKEASQYIAHRGAGGMQITGYLFGIESLVELMPSIYNHHQPNWSKGEKVNLKQLLKKQPLLKLLG